MYRDAIVKKLVRFCHYKMVCGRYLANVMCFLQLRTYCPLGGIGDTCMGTLVLGEGCISMRSVQTVIESINYYRLEIKIIYLYLPVPYTTFKNGTGLRGFPSMHFAP